ncbi:MAG: hypothetical protein GKR89_27985 [Candidatus Latescibacteria bacterium]|nr:hypothetical protein [Candidatus Latescibacterota bacterium]
MRIKCVYMLLAVLACLASPAAVRANMEAAEVKALLLELQERQTWGEAMLQGGHVRSIKVNSVAGDTVAVVEVMGAFHRRPAQYTLGDFRSLRELGQHRIAQRRAPYQGRKSMTVALALEALVPGSGYLYTGQNRQGLVLMGMAAGVLGVAIATEKDGAAGWVPFAAWIKLSSLVNLAEEVQAINHQRDIGGGLGLGAVAGAAPGMQMRWTF